MGSHWIKSLVRGDASFYAPCSLGEELGLILDARTRSPKFVSAGTKYGIWGLNMLGGKRADFYALEARRLGYPARSVFKLQEIQRKWKLLRRPLLDLGASPGSWTLFALRTLGHGARVVAIDLEDLDVRPPPGCKISFLRGDIFSQRGMEFVKQGGPYGCVLSDAAPATTGNRVVDTARSYNLALQVLNIAEANLIVGGNLVLKFFQGGDEGELQDRMERIFGRVRFFRPRAVRQSSMEVYIVGMKRRPYET